MIEQQKKATSSIERPRLQEDPESKVGLPPDVQDLASPLAAGPGHVADTNSVVANEGQPHDCRLVPTLPPEVARDRRLTIKRLWLVLIDPDRPCDSVSAECRLGLIRNLQTIIRMGIFRTTGPRGHVVRYFECLAGNGKGVVLA